METTVTAKKTTLKGGYLFFVAYLIFTLGFYALYNVNSLNVYYVSYYARSNPYDGITIKSVYFTNAILGFANAIGVSVSGLLEQKTGIRITLVVATCLGLITSIILLFFTNVPLYLLACFIVGLGEGLCMINSKYLCMFFPGQEGFVTAFTKPFFAAFTSGWFILGEAVVNEKATQLEDETAFYDKKISDNVPILSWMMIVSLIFGTILFMVITMRINFENVKKESKEIADREKAKNEIETDVPTGQLEAKEIYMHNLSLIFHSAIYWKFFFLSVLLTFEPMLIQISYRVLCDNHHIDLNTIKINYNVSGILGAFSSIAIGKINDKYGMKWIIVSVGIAFCCSGVFYIFTLSYSSGLFFCFAIYLSNVFVVLIQAILFPNLVKIFGVKYITEIYGPLVIVMTAVSFLLSFIFFIFEGIKKDDLPYFILIGIGSFLAFASLFISLTIDVKAFDFGNKKEDNEQNVELDSNEKLLPETNEDTK